MRYVYNVGQPTGSGIEIYEEIEAVDYETSYGVLTFYSNKGKILSKAPGTWSEVFPSDE